jgi:hypothetical protein
MQCSQTSRQGGSLLLVSGERLQGCGGGTVLQRVRVRTGEGAHRPLEKFVPQWQSIDFPPLNGNLPGSANYSGRLPQLVSASKLPGSTLGWGGR